LLIQGHIPPLAFEGSPRLLRTTVLRDPVERLLSNFCYVYKTRYQSPQGLAFLKDCPGYRQGRFTAGDLERWIEYSRQDNYQTRFLSGCRDAELGPDAICAAQEALESCEVVGTTEDMSGYILALAQISGLEIREAIHANISPRDIIDEDMPSLRDRLRIHVGQDRILYEYARTRFARLADCLDIPQPPSLATVPEEIAAPGFVRRMITLARRRPADQGRQIWRSAQDLLRA